MFNSLLKVLNLINKSDKKKGIVLISLLVFSVFIETLTLALVLPITTIILEPNEKAFLSYLKIENINFSKETIILIFLLATLIKFFLLNYISYKQAKFLFAIENNFSKKLLNIYLFLSYENFNKVGINKILHQCHAQMNSLRTDVFIPGLLVVSEGLVVLSIATLLLWVDPFSTLVLAAIFYLPSVILKFTTKKKLLLWGNDRKVAENDRANYIAQVLKIYDYIKIINKENFFINRYEKILQMSSNPAIKQLSIQNFPRILIELLIVIAMMTLVLIQHMRGLNISELLPLLGLFVAAGFRIMPSINRIYYGMQSVTYAMPLIHDLADRLVDSISPEIIKEKDKKFNFSEVEFKDVTFSYITDNIIFKNMNIKIKAGKYIGICGKSGSGKTAFIKLFLNFIEPSSGKIEVNGGVSLKSLSREWQNIIGYVAQDVVLIDGPIWSNIAIGIDESELDINRLAYCIKVSKLDELINKVQGGTNYLITSNMNLSGGERQRLGIARALYTQPKILLLDEATSSLDERTENQILDLIDLLKGKITIISVTHRFNVIKRCDEVYELKDLSLNLKAIK